MKSLVTFPSSPPHLEVESYAEYAFQNQAHTRQGVYQPQGLSQWFSPLLV